MHTSDYNIYIPLPGSDEHVLIHGYSGAVDVTKNQVVAFLQGARDGGPTEAPLTAETIETLKKRGYLTERTPEQERAFVRNLGRVLYRLQKNNAHFLLMPTYDCNLRCPYCYEKKLRRNGQGWMGKTMDRTAVDAAYDAMVRIRRDLKNNRKRKGDDSGDDSGDSNGSGDGTARQITLYGGEPFLERNAAIVNYVVEKGADLGYAFGAVTNGVELNGFLHLLGKETGKVASLQITLDGPARIHDKRRCTAAGRATFAEIARNVSAALERGVQVSLRTNVDKVNVEHIAELVEFYVAQGWVDKPNFSAHCSAVHLPPAATGQDKLLTDLGLARLAQARLAQASADWHPRVRLLTPDQHLQGKFTQLLSQQAYPRFSPVHCGSQIGMYLFDPHGDVYVCWDSVGEPVGKVGTYLPELALDQQALSQWTGRTVMSIPACVKCKYALLCGGGCAQHAYYENATLLSPLCRDFGVLLEQAVATYQKSRERELAPRVGPT